MIFKDLATVAPGIQIRILADRYSKDINNYVAKHMVSGTEKEQLSAM
jgi:hypothetical protein